MWILALVSSIGFLAALTYGILITRKARRDKSKAAALSKEIIDYFHKTGVDVTVVSTNLKGDERFTALIESEPMKRFRLSHIIEHKMRDHIHKTLGLELECIYWRFPIKLPNQHVFPSVSDDPETIMPAAPSETTKKTDADHDDYITEGMVPYKDVPKIEVEELSWEKFEQEAGNRDSEDKRASE
jgi:hypothetical protein